MPIILIILILFFTAQAANAVTYFSFDAESGYQYMGSGNPHAGGGYFSAMGGLISGSAGTGCSDPDVYHNSVVSTDAAGQGAIVGSTASLKTPYDGDCPDESFQRDTTTIRTGNLYEGYMRWYQKFTGDWNSASGTGAQHKFTKFYDGIAGSQTIVHFSFGAGAENWRSYLPNIDGHWNKDGVTRASDVWVYQSTGGQGDVYEGVNRSYDDYSNGIGGTDGELYYVPDTWYCLEVHWKVNTDTDTSDAVLEAWVNGSQVFGAYNFKYYDSGSRPYVNTFELQHIYYNRTANDQPTYMDNIVIADTYIGPINYTPPTLSFTGVTFFSGGSIQ